MTDLDLTTLWQWLTANQCKALLDIVSTVIGLVYLWLEYRASIWLWLASVVMPIVSGFLYYTSGLYADSAMQLYYVLAAIYGFAMWRMGGRKKGSELRITHFARGKALPAALVWAALWGGIYLLLIHFTDSRVPLLDSFTTATSVVALWALAHKWVEQWLLWLVVDVVCTALYFYKGIPFHAMLYGFYSVMAVAGYRKWKSMMHTE